MKLVIKYNKKTEKSNYSLFFIIDKKSWNSAETMKLIKNTERRNEEILRGKTRK